MSGLGRRRGVLSPLYRLARGLPAVPGGMAPCVGGERPGAVGASPVGLGTGSAEAGRLEPSGPLGRPVVTGAGTEPWAVGVPGFPAMCGAKIT